MYGGDMMIVNRAYKFRLYPSVEQIILINKTFGCARLVYNHYLNKKQEFYKETKESLSLYDCIKDLKELSIERPFLKEVDSMSLRCALFDLEDSYKNFFKQNKRYPKYKSKYDKNTYRTNYIKNTYKGKEYENIASIWLLSVLNDSMYILTNTDKRSVFDFTFCIKTLASRNKGEISFEYSGLVIFAE